MSGYLCISKPMNLFIVLCFMFSTHCYAVKHRSPSATSNVQILNKIFNIPILGRERMLRIYLPPDYFLSNKKYPVLYMHDGQNLFDDSTSFVGEWGVDETLNQLAKTTGLSLIVVGIDNGQEKRMNELSPWKNEKYGKAEGEIYMDFIVQDIKPYIDQTYRTLSDQENTAIMGSSMGGLISHYAIFKYPEVFSKAGIFSPSYWYSEEVYKFSQSTKLNSHSKLYLLIGGKEGIEEVDCVKKMYDHLSSQHVSQKNLQLKVVADGEHNERFWKAEFKEAILWLFSKEPDFY